MINTDFYKWFDKFSPKLQIRKDAFYKIFNYLDKMPDPIIIVETGCLRITNNFLDGQSTLLFEKYTQFRKNKAKVLTVDIDPKSNAYAKNIRKGDIITEVGKETINTYYEYMLTLEKYNSGDAIMIRIISNGNARYDAFEIN